MKRLNLLHLSKNLITNSELAKIKGGANADTACSPNSNCGTDASASVNECLKNMRINNPTTSMCVDAKV